MIRTSGQSAKQFIERFFARYGALAHGDGRQEDQKDFEAFFVRAKASMTSPSRSDSL